MIQSAGVGALALVVGVFLTHRIAWLQRFCIPSPVSGGLIFSLLTLAVYKIWGLEITFTGTLKDAFMLAFFTSVGFQSNPKVLRQGGRTLVVMLLLLVVIIVMQNVLPLGIAYALDLNPLTGMAAGSISMAGGHGTAGGFSSVLENMGLKGALTISMAAATFGLIAGSMIGGPVAERLIRCQLGTVDQQPKSYTIDPAMAGFESNESLPTGHLQHVSDNEQEFQQYARATYALLIVMGAGTLVSYLLARTGITFPTYFGALLLAALVRTVAEYTQHAFWK